MNLTLAQCLLSCLCLPLRCVTYNSSYYACGTLLMLNQSTALWVVCGMKRNFQKLQRCLFSWRRIDTPQIFPTTMDIYCSVVQAAKCFYPTRKCCSLLLKHRDEFWKWEFLILILRDLTHLASAASFLRVNSLKLELQTSVMQRKIGQKMNFSSYHKQLVCFT